MELARDISGRRDERGFSLLEMVIALAVITVLSTIALLGATSSRAGQRRVNSARMLSSYLEKARVDSVRRRAEGTSENPNASVTIADSDTYRVYLDFERRGTPVAREFNLDPGVAFKSEHVGTVISFNWRGRTSQALRLEVFNTDHRGDERFSTGVSISSFGDVSVNDDGHTPEINSNTSHFASPTPAPTVSPTPEATPTPGPTPEENPVTEPTPKHDSAPPSETNLTPTRDAPPSTL